VGMKDWSAAKADGSAGEGSRGGSGMGEKFPRRIGAAMGGEELFKDMTVAVLTVQTVCAS
jgi:hypothetical protein